MTLRQLKQTFFSELNSLYPQTEIESFFYILTDAYLNLKRVDIALQIDAKIEIDDRFDNALNELIQQKPIQYIIGNTDFFGLQFKVNKHVLIPRPETEELVHWIIQEIEIKNPIDKKINILDIGTGSGCIAVSLAKNTSKTKVTALDISTEALKTAKENATINKMHIDFIKDDILKPKSNVQNTKFDIIVSNPPYVRELEKKEIQKNVLNNEPHLALFVKDENPLLFYNAIADFALKHLDKDGDLYFEINQYLGIETVKLLKNKGFASIELKKDMYGKDRMIRCSL